MRSEARRQKLAVSHRRVFALHDTEVQRTVPADHPALAGHFPGNPIVPGVVILDEVIAAIGEVWPDCRVVAVASAKFMSPLRPDQTITIAATKAFNGTVRFSCKHEGRIVAQGVFEISEI